MIDFESKLSYDIFDLRNIMRILRSEDGCPWDREQTHKSIRRNMLEEAYETASAIDEDNPEDLKEELGDVLMQVLFHADIAEDGGNFSFDDVIDVTCKKLISRHPHVFSNAHVTDGEDSLKLWEEVKREEKNFDTVSDSMRSTACALPALWRAEKIQKKAAKAGFDWPDYTGAFKSLKSELDELSRAIEANDTGAIQEELGDLLFSAVNTARFFKVDPEDALNASSDKFIKRFSKIEEEATAKGKALGDLTNGNKLTFGEMEEIYQKIK